MDLLKIKECKGYTTQEAFKDLNFVADDPLIKSNVTNSWFNAGKPYPGTTAFKLWATKILDKRTRTLPGKGLYIVIRPPIPDTRRLPFTVVNDRERTVKKWVRIYQIREDLISLRTEGNEASISIREEGPIVAECPLKKDAIEKMKELTIQNHKSYSLLCVKIPAENRISAVCVYTPSKKARKGKYIAFGINAEI